MRHPFKVLNAVVCLIVVDMVNLWQVKWVWDVRLGNQAVDFLGYRLLSKLREDHALIAEAVDMRPAALAFGVNNCADDRPEGADQVFWVFWMW